MHTLTLADLTPAPRRYTTTPPPPFRHGGARCVKVLESCRLFPVNLLVLLYVCCEKILKFADAVTWRGTTVVRGQRGEGPQAPEHYSLDYCHKMLKQR